MFINSCRLSIWRLWPRVVYRWISKEEVHVYLWGWTPSLSSSFKQTLCAASSFALLQRTFLLFNMSPFFFPLSTIYRPFPSLLSQCISSTRSCFQRPSYFSVRISLLLLVQSISNSGFLFIFIGYHLRQSFRKRLWIIEITRCLCRTPYSSLPVFSWLLVFVSGQSCSLSNLFWSLCSL